MDDDEDMRKLLADELGDWGCPVIQAANGQDALMLIQQRVPSLVVTDLNMPGGWFEYLDRLKEALPQVPIIVITAYGESRTKAVVFSLGMAGYFEKPVRMADLKSLVKKVCPMGCYCPHGSDASARFTM